MRMQCTMLLRLRTQHTCHVLVPVRAAPPPRLAASINRTPQQTPGSMQHTPPALNALCTQVLVGLGQHDTALVIHRGQAVGTATAGGAEGASLQQARTLMELRLRCAFGVRVEGGVEEGERGPMACSAGVLAGVYDGETGETGHGPGR